MVNTMLHSVRTFLLATLLALSAGVARATEAVSETASDGPPLDGLLIIGALVAALVFIAWVASRFGDD